MCQSAATGIYFLVLYFLTPSALQTVIDELEGIWTENVMALIEVLSRNFPGRT
jgi:hypothetical protein